MNKADQNGQINGSLKECVKQMYQDHLETGDVTIQVGEEGAEVKAHTFILISRSRVFFSIFEKQKGLGKKTLKVDDVTKDVFLQFLEFLYTDITDVNEGNFDGLMFCAWKYEVDLLSALCKESLKKFITLDTVCKMMAYARFYNDPEMTEICLNTVEINTPSFLFTALFFEMCSSCVHQITQHDRIFASEEVIFERVLEWSSEECTKQNLPITAKNQRKVLGNIIYGVRFPIMDRKYVDSVVCGSDVLNDQDKIEILRQQLDPKEEKAKRFEIRKRIWQPTNVMRTSYQGSHTNCMFKVDEFGLTFKVSSYSVLIGVHIMNIENFRKINFQTTLHGHIMTTKAAGTLHPAKEFSVSFYGFEAENILMLYPHTLIPLKGNVEYTLLFYAVNLRGNRISKHIEHKRMPLRVEFCESVEFNGKTCSLYNTCYENPRYVGGMGPLYNIYYDDSIIGGLLIT